MSRRTREVAVGTMQGGLQTAWKTEKIGLMSFSGVPHLSDKTRRWRISLPVPCLVVNTIC